MASYIHDGWTREDGFISEEKDPGNGEILHGPLSFSYRPATRMEVVRIDKEIELCQKDGTTENAIKAEKLGCDWLAKHLVSWDLKNSGGHDVPVNQAALERLQPYLFGKLYRIIRGTQASDKKLEEDKSPLSDEELQKN